MPDSIPMDRPWLQPPLTETSVRRYSADQKYLSVLGNCTVTEWHKNTFSHHLNLIIIRNIGLLNQLIDHDEIAIN